jgi:transposase
MNPRIKYCVELAKIRHLPDYKRVRAETRFFLIKEYEDYLEKLSNKFGEELDTYKNARDFFVFKNIAETTFYNWLRAYRKHGIEGLIPHFGNRKKNIQLSAISNTEHKKRGENSNNIRAQLDIKTDSLILFLDQLLTAIVASSLVSPHVKSECLKFLERIYDLSLRKTPIKLTSPLTEHEKNYLEECRSAKNKRQSIRATALLMMDEGRTMLEIGLATNSTESTIYNWLSAFNKRRTGFIKVTVSNPKKIAELELRTTRVIDILHKMPSLYGINRTAWTYGAIVEAYQKEYDDSISLQRVCRVIKLSGYTWRRASKVLTSVHPETPV